MYALARRNRAGELDHDDEKLISHPYAVGSLISSISFVVIFRANFGYQRYAYFCFHINCFVIEYGLFSYVVGLVFLLV